jgi:hypothetical protein
MPRRKQHYGEEKSARDAVFLNIPYDEQFTQLFLAYVIGIRAYGLIPRATLEIPGGARRLDRIASLIRSCTYSVHDPSRVELDPAPPPTPRFNMPFELGLAVAFHWRRSAKHTWFVLETEKWRIQKSLSDLNGCLRSRRNSGRCISGTGKSIRQAESPAHCQATADDLSGDQGYTPQILRRRWNR